MKKLRLHGINVSVAGLHGLILEFSDLSCKFIYVGSVSQVQYHVWYLVRKLNQTVLELVIQITELKGKPSSNLCSISGVLNCSIRVLQIDMPVLPQFVLHHSAILSMSGSNSWLMNIQSMDAKQMCQNVEPAVQEVDEGTKLLIGNYEYHQENWQGCHCCSTTCEIKVRPYVGLIKMHGNLFVCHLLSDRSNLRIWQPR